jgi:hypothetical protein
MIEAVVEMLKRDYSIYDVREMTEGRIIFIFDTSQAVALYGAYLTQTNEIQLSKYTDYPCELSNREVREESKRYELEMNDKLQYLLSEVQTVK